MNKATLILIFSLGINHLIAQTPNNYPATGNVLLGSNTDNNVNKLQVTGTALIKDQTATGQPLIVESDWDNTSVVQFHNKAATGPTSMGLRLSVANSLKFQILSGGSGYSLAPNGTILQDVSNGGMDFVSSSYFSWGPLYKASGGSKMIFYPTSGNLLIGSTTDNGKRLQVTGDSYFNGKLGIGTPSPLSNLHVYNGAGASSFLLETNSSSAYSEISVRNASAVATSYFRQYSSGASGSDFGVSRSNLATFFSNYAANFAIGTQNGGDLILGSANTERMRFTASGNILATGKVLIGNMTGINTGTHLLAVNGSVIATKVVVKTASNWPDYVFHPTYQLRSLSSLEDYIKRYKHLPDVPSAEEIETSGNDLGATQAALLKKIEELTLYVIEQGKQLEKLEKRIKLKKI